MHKVLLFMKRREGLSFNAFRAYYEIRHVPLCMTYMGDAKRYVRRYIERRKGEPEPEFDVITLAAVRGSLVCRRAAQNAAQGVAPTVGSELCRRPSQ